MAVVAGIDEAGYGPRLGPLVVSAAAFEVPDAAAGDDLWERLSPVVSRSGREAGGTKVSEEIFGDSLGYFGFQPVAVDDSKRLFSQAVGLRRIERTTLAFAAAAGQAAKTFRGLLAALAELDEELEAYPWYAGVDFGVPLAAEVEQIGADGARLGSAAGARFLGARSMPVLEGEFNRIVESVGTKAAALFLRTARLLTYLWERWGERGLTVHVDKHGGRDRYGLLLHQTFFGARIRTLREGHDESVYEIADGRRRMSVGFYVEGDRRHLPIALASCYSKYFRELFMRGFNAYWAAQVPGLRPTAGYGLDAGRFLREIEDARRQLGIPEHRLVRRA